MVSCCYNFYFREPEHFSPLCHQAIIMGEIFPFALCRYLFNRGPFIFLVSPVCKVAKASFFMQFLLGIIFQVRAAVFGERLPELLFLSPPPCGIAVSSAKLKRRDFWSYNDAMHFPNSHLF